MTYNSAFDTTFYTALYMAITESSHTTLYIPSSQATYPT
jgi:hypothetical protein